MKRFLIIGFGRMGITHLAHINGLLDGNCSFDVYDPSTVFRGASLFRIRTNINFLRKIPEAGRYDGVVITSPPEAHATNFDAAMDLSDTFFVEKPLALHNVSLSAIDREKKEIFCGYVLRKNPCVKYLGNLLRDRSPTHVEVSVRSNLGLQGSEDWRFDLRKGGGCLNELGSHAINLGLAFLRDKRNIVDSLTIDELSVPRFQISAPSPSEFRFYGSWNEDVRKTTYKINVVGNGFRLQSDLQSVSGELDGGRISWSPHEEELDVGYYMRGTDFALQAQDFVHRAVDNEAFHDAVRTDGILEKVLTHA